MIDMLSLGTDTLILILWYLTGYYYTWHLYYIASSWLSLLWELDMIIILLPDIWYSWTPVLLNSYAPELLCFWTLEQGDSWYHTPIDPCNWLIMDIGILCIHCGHYHWITYIIKYSTYTGVGKTDGYRYDVIFIMVDISEVSCGVRNDNSSEAVAWSLKCRVERVMISLRK